MSQDYLRDFEERIAPASFYKRLWRCLSGNCYDAIAGTAKAEAIPVSAIACGMTLDTVFGAEAITGGRSYDSIAGIIDGIKAPIDAFRPHAHPTTPGYRIATIATSVSIAAVIAAVPWRILRGYSRTSEK
jgi:hypothetical protein